MTKRRQSIGAIIAVVIVALLLAAEVARLTVASAVAEKNPSLASKLAPFVPPTLSSEAMAQVGQAAAQGANPDERTLEQLRAIARIAPLQTEPFLVDAALAQRAGKYSRAQQLLFQAELRDPRSAAARYLYADVAVRQGKIVEGLREMAVLSRLMPDAAMQLVPALAQFARMPGSRDKLNEILAQNPNLKSPLLNALVTNPDNAELVVALAGPPSTSQDGSTRGWQSRLLSGMIRRGEYQRAYNLWREFSLIPEGAQSLLFNESFRALPAPPPFNWSFRASSGGLVESGGQGLRVLYYGRKDVTLASELLLLAPRNYRFVSAASGDLDSGDLSWTLRCIDGGSSLMDVPLTAGRTAASFAVPSSGCPAQQLQLNGLLEQSPHDTDVRIWFARIQRAGS